MEKNIQNTILLDIYGKCLTKKQLNIMDDYYNNDLSLSEIAENEKITRQAVNDNLKKGEAKLLNMEKKLKIMEDKTKREEEIQKALLKLTKISKKTTDKEVAVLVKELQQELSNVK